ncbi:MAG: BON domain-containing protein [Anaerolineales bacterium]|nr:BON domain-containing protein [Anaerolineales bacterium]
MMQSSQPTAKEEDLQIIVQDRLRQFEPLRTLGGQLSVDILPEGKVEVAGIVQTKLIREEALALVNQTPGVTDVLSNVLTDPEIEVSVAEVLATDDRTKSIKPGMISVRSHLGSVTLLGQIPAETDRETVVRVVGSVSGVRTIVDELQT